MSEIVAKLRGTAILDELRQIADEAANEIDRLNAALRQARIEALEEAMGKEPTQAEIYDACLSYRHDFGLLDREERIKVAHQAKWWLDAWRKTLSRALKDKQP